MTGVRESLSKKDQATFDAMLFGDRDYSRYSTLALALLYASTPEYLDLNEITAELEHRSVLEMGSGEDFTLYLSPHNASYYRRHCGLGKVIILHRYQTNCR